MYPALRPYVRREYKRLEDPLQLSLAKAAEMPATAFNLAIDGVPGGVWRTLGHDPWTQGMHPWQQREHDHVLICMCRPPLSLQTQ